MKPAGTVQEDSGAEAPQILSFSVLEEKISTYLPDTSGPLIDRDDKIAAAITVFSFLAVTIATAFKSSKIAAVVLFIALGLELVGFFLMLRAKLRKEIPEILDRRRIFATELDQQLHGYGQIVNWLKTHTERELEEKLYYIRKKMESITNRVGFMFGGIERLGFLPVLVALYLQFKDVTWAWPPDLKLSSGILGWAVFVVYLIGVYAVSLKWQLESYIRFLEMATESLPSEKSANS